MIQPPENGRRFTSHEEEDDEEEQKQKARPFSAILRSSTSEKEKPEKESSEDYTTNKEKETSSSNKEDVPEPEKAQEDTEEVSIEDLKRSLVKDQLAVEIADLEEQSDAAAFGSPEKAEADAALAFARAVDQKVDNPALEVDPTVEVEYQKRMAEISDEDIAENLEELIELPEATPLEIAHDNEPVTSPLQPVNKPRTVSPPTPSPTVAAATTPASSTPTTPPSPPAGAPPRGPSGIGGYSPGGAEAGAPSAASVESDLYRPKVETPPRRSSNKAGAFLIGGLLGRRHGIKVGKRRTEAEYKPQVEQLNAEVARTQATLTAREAEIKRAAGEKQREQLIQTPAPERPTTTEKTGERVMQPVDRTPVREILRKTVSSPMEVIPAATTAAKVEQKPTRQNVAEEVKRVERTTTPVLLKTAEDLYISGVSVRRLYETNQIDRSGLVELVQTALRGGNIKDVFEKVQLGAERQRERAREFRHDPAADDSTTNDTGQPTTPLPLNNGSPPAQTLPNTPDAAELEPVTFDHSEPTQTDATELEPLDVDQLVASKPSQTRVVAIVAVILALLLVIFLLSL